MEHRCVEGGVKEALNCRGDESPHVKMNVKRRVEETNPTVWI